MNLKYQLRSVEKIPLKIWKDSKEASRHVARAIASAIRDKQEDGKQIILGLATGSSPIQVYEELVRMHKEDGLSFRNVVTFNLDEYYPMQPEAAQSYVRFMNENLFDHVDIPRENIHVPDGTINMEDVDSYCERYEKLIDYYGGIDVQLLGIGRTGHIGFNEPGSWEKSSTRMVRLDGMTRKDAIKDFGNEDKVPYRAITMGISSIMKSRKIYILAWGSHKAQIVKEAVEGEISSAVPATFLQNHPNVRFNIDIPAAEELTVNSTPWLVGICNWNEDLVCKAVVWLSLKTGKPILKLLEEDYSENHLGDLTIEYDHAYNINIKVFNRLQNTITGWPGGKPNSDDSTRPERAKPAKKRVILFSPHPDDDVISMGATFIRLVEQGHDVHVAYQTSGNIAVHDHDALRFAEFMQEFHEKAGIKCEPGFEIYQKSIQFLRAKEQSEMTDIEEVKLIKGMIRRGEARAGARFAGLHDDHIHFLDMPFYETGKTRKKPLGPQDIQIVADLMQQVKPHQVFAAGDLADPHGTHRVCLDAVFGAFKQLSSEKWISDCWLWLYRGAWHEWSIDEIEMAVPFSPKQLEQKRRAIFMHQSQKDRAPFPGNDSREFWQRAEDRNSSTAKMYRMLGLAEYEAIEAFRRWKF